MTIVPPRPVTWGDDGAGDAAGRALGRQFWSGRLRVLLVEDEPGDARLVKMALAQSRTPAFVVVHAATLAEAITQSEAGPPFDVVLLDLSLPDSAGESTFVRMHQAAPKAPIVIMTGLDDPHFADHALEIGAQDYLVKSDEPERTVVRAIRYAITRMNAQIERDALALRVASHRKALLLELAAARTMQFGLLPRADRLDPRFRELELDVEAAFEPSLGIGGDLWGCMDYGYGRIGFYTFDFSGHGIAAALNVFRLHALIADRWMLNPKPGDLLEAVGKTLPGMLARGQYATMLACVVDTVKNQLEWASAGSPPPFLIEGGTTTRLDSHGVPLGLDSQPSHPTFVRAFPPGASLILYSDALTDTADTDGEPFGEDRLAGLVDTIAGEDGCCRIRTLMDRFYSMIPPPLPDDVTAVRISRALGEGRQ